MAQPPKELRHIRFLVYSLDYMAAMRKPTRAIITITPMNEMTVPAIAKPRGCLNRPITENRAPRNHRIQSKNGNPAEHDSQDSQHEAGSAHAVGFLLYDIVDDYGGALLGSGHYRRFLHVMVQFKGEYLGDKISANISQFTKINAPSTLFNIVLTI